MSDVGRDEGTTVAAALERVALRQRGPDRLAMPMAMIGPRVATEEQLSTAEAVARAFAGAGVALLCGGKGGVMEAAARGAREANGLVVGLLPEDDDGQANPYLSVALPTGLGITRNALIARASLCLVAVGGGLGTLSEIALGLQWGKPVFGICGAPQVQGIEQCEDQSALLLRVARWLADVGVTSRA